MTRRQSPLHPRRGALERRILVLCTMLVIVGVLLMVKMPQHIAAMEEQQQYDADFYQFAELFSEIYSQIRANYVEEVDKEKLFEGAINGMFMELDPHSSYLPPVDQEMLTKDTEGEYSGVGLHITLDKNKILTVISPIAGSPAARVGVQPWDRIVEIEGKSTENISLMEAVNKLTGPTGTEVKVKIWREGAPELLDFTIRREVIKVESVFSKIIDENIGYLRITKFQDDTAEDVKKALTNFNQQGVEGVIVDLRFNAGGLLDRAVEICDFFLDKNQLIVSIQGRHESNNRKYYALNDKLCDQWLVVLVNHGSASASEIFAGAMQDTRRGIIIGPKDSTTFGKGSVQTISTLRHSLERDENGNPKPSGLRLTTALYYTPSGKSIHEKGIAPDFGVELPEGHEVELFRHGLLGDPPQIEPGLEGTPALDDEITTGSLDESREGPTHDMIELEQGTPDENAPALPDADAPATGEGETPDGQQMLELLRHRRDNLSSEDQDAPESGEFEDILLNEAVKYLKAIVYFEKQKVA
ncbi:MAG TPA: S41 family peptidase [Candidatus Sumerlaeota bacterium]|nr:S41 family peptidase [Candidatus Sumerlaeota bacterium]